MVRCALGLLAVAMACGGDDATTTPDAGPDGAGGLPTACDGACRTTTLTAQFGATTRVLDRAVYGVTAIAGQAPSTAPGTVGASLLDFEGDLLGGPLGAASTAATAAAVALDVCPTCVGQAAPADPDGLVALDVDATFSGGTVVGHLFAQHCDSLDATE